MKAFGVGEAHGAISVLNAIPTGIGGAIGVNLRMKAEVKLLNERIVRGVSIVRGCKIEIPQFILNAALEVFKGKFGFQGGLEVKVESEIPIARGLKSSSALVNSIAMGFLNAIEHKYTIIDVAMLGAEIAKRAGITITGAFDDSMASLGKGLYITDNLGLKIVKHMYVEEAYAVIHIPSYENPIYNVDANMFRRFRRYYDIAVNLALQGEWKRAMMLNGLLTAIVIKSDISPILKALSLPETITAGVSGKGPALVALTYSPESIVNLWNDLEGETIVTKLLGGYDESENTPVEDFCRRRS